MKPLKSLKSSVVGRFAPSPTGELHFGSLLAALASWLDARSRGGRWLVRMEDVDEPRCRQEWADSILRTLDAHGLTWDGEVVVQSQRTHIYRSFLERLRERALVYPCSCSRRTLAHEPRNAMGEAIYPGTCAHGMAEPSASRLTHRFRVNQGLVAFEDVHRGPVAEDVAREVGDFIVLRSEGYFAYHLAVVVDDALQGVTDIVRGGDLLLATPRQILLQRALGFPTPRYLHLPVATHATGAKLSKQTHATPLASSCASKNLARALLALGQSLPGAIASTDAAIEALRDKPPWEILEEAQLLWNPSKLPSATSFVLSDGS